MKYQSSMQAGNRLEFYICVVDWWEDRSHLENCGYSSIGLYETAKRNHHKWTHIPVMFVGSEVLDAIR